MKKEIGILISSFLCLWSSFTLACSVPSYLIFNQAQASTRCPNACSSAGGWDGGWSCPNDQYCVCSCKGPCNYSQNSKLAGPK